MWLESRSLNDAYRKRLIRELDRHVTTISQTADVFEIFNSLTRGQKHNLIRAVRALFNFLESQGWNKDWLDILRRNVPKDNIGIDVKIPSEAKIILSLEAMSQHATKYNTLYNLILDSGLRLTEAVKFNNAFSLTEVEEVNGFCIAPLGYFRFSKIAYYALFTRETLQKLESQPRDIIYENANSYTKKFTKKVVPWKYLRKFMFDKMIDLEIPESVADFIQGRTPKTIGAKHYMALRRQAQKYYPRYAEYMTQLRKKTLNSPVYS